MSTFADYLRALPDDDLAALVRLRPDLVIPVPADCSALAVRAQSRLSVARALDGLDRFTLEILDALRLTRTSETTSVEAVLTLTAQGGVDAAAVRVAIDRLRGLALVYGHDSALHVIGGVDEVCSPYPAGLGRPAAELDAAAADLVRDAAGLRRALLAAPPQATAVLHRLAAGPPVGTVAAVALRTPDPDSPVGWLVAHQLLVPVADDTVELPREVALLLRREAGPLGPLHPQPPTIDGAPREVKAVDQAAAGQAMEAVRSAEALLDGLAAEPTPVLRAGGVGVRELRRLSKVAGVDPGVAGLLLEVCYASGLIGESATENIESILLPTLGYDSWRSTSIAARWTRLARAWLAMSRAPALIGQRDERDRLIAALSAEVERTGAPAYRRGVLTILADLAPGAAPSTDDVGELLAWRTPRRAGRGAWANGPAEVLAEAAALGLTGLGAISGYGRRLLASLDAEPDADADPLGLSRVDDGSPDAVAMLHDLLPAPAEQVVIQADLTVVAPGPPEPGLAAELAVVAEPESPNVFRVTAESVRRALDIGYAASDLHALFARRSRTRVPQALTYLVDDVARRHGGLRAGSAGSYLRSEDEALIAEVLVDRRLAGLGLRRLAPTVLASPYPVSRLLAALREAGYAPVPEDAAGAIVLTRPKARRAAARPAVPARREDPLAMPRLTAPRLAGVVEQIRRGDAAARAARRAPVSVRAANGSAGPSAQAHTQALAVLQQALRDRVRVWVGYVDAHGAAASRLVRPISMGAGYLRAEDERTEMMHTFALHRITAAVLDE
jgi:Helicase conserved C-terminal domain